MKRYVGVKFRDQGQIYYFDSGELELSPGDYVIVSTEEGLGLAEVVVERSEPLPDLPDNVKTIERVASEEDLQQLERNRQLERQAFRSCQQQIRRLELEMKLVDVEVRFDQSKTVFYFTAPTRVDFRELVKVLVNEFRTRIELRQIGVRHEAQILGGLGNCGRICCCHLFMRRFEPVTIKMAKEQQLFLNPSKISGTCGRLLCCLNFERKAYADFQKRCPKVGKKYSTPEGELKVLRANLFRDSLVVGTESGDEKEMTLIEWAELFSSDAESSEFEAFVNEETHVSPEVAQVERAAEQHAGREGCGKCDAPRARNAERQAKGNAGQDREQKRNSGRPAGRKPHKRKERPDKDKEPKSSEAQQQQPKRPRRRRARAKKKK
jgi:cell fate regulator YaaT (PSP1 superfamily)